VKKLAFVLLLCMCSSLYSEKISQRMHNGFEPVRDQVQDPSSGAAVQDVSQREFWCDVVVNYVCYATGCDATLVSCDPQQFSAIDSYDGWGLLTIPVVVFIKDVAADVTLCLRGMGICDGSRGELRRCVRVGLSGGTDGRTRFETVASISLW